MFTISVKEPYSWPLVQSNTLILQCIIAVSEAFCVCDCSHTNENEGQGNAKGQDVAPQGLVVLAVALGKHAKTGVDVVFAQSLECITFFMYLHILVLHTEKRTQNHNVKICDCELLMEFSIYIDTV